MEIVYLYPNIQGYVDRNLSLPSTEKEGEEDVLKSWLKLPFQELFVLLARGFFICAVLIVFFPLHFYLFLLNGNLMFAVV